LRIAVDLLHGLVQRHGADRHGEFRTMPSRVEWMCLPVDRSITVSAPQRQAQVSLSTSSAIEEETADVPMLALIFTRNRSPITIGSDSDGSHCWAGSPARPRSRPHDLGIQVLSDRRELHLRCDGAARAYRELGHRLTCLPAARLAAVAALRR